jgi:ABC-2 type transport system ATP-binding protein
MLFLDEPTTGLDPQSRAALWDQVRRLRAGGTAVLLTTHYLDEADALCDRLLVIDHGRIVAEGTPEGLKRGVGGDVVALGAGARPGSGSGTGTGAGAGAGAGADRGLGRDGGAGLARAADAVRGVPGVREAVVGGGGLRVTTDPGAGAAALGALAAAGVPLDDATLTRPTLDDVFLSLTGRSLRDGGPAGAGPEADADTGAAGAPALAAR